MTAVERGAPPDDCLRAAGGIYLRERQSAVEALLRLLQARSFPDTHAPADPQLALEVDAYVLDLLGGASAGAPTGPAASPTLIARLVDILAAPSPGSIPTPPTPTPPAPYVVQTSPGASLQTPGGATLAPAPAPRTDVSSDPHAASAALEHVADERGRPCRRSEWFAHERRLTAECLYHAVLSTRRDGGAVSGADAAKIAEVFATVAAPTLAATVAHDRARRATEAFARMDAAAPPSAIFPDATPAEAENLPSAIATLFALVAATTPAAGGAGGAAPFAAAIDAAGTALDAALAKAEAAAKAALDDAGAGADGDPLRAAFARSPLADAAPPARPHGGHGAVGGGHGAVGYPAAAANGLLHQTGTGASAGSRRPSGDHAGAYLLEADGGAAAATSATIHVARFVWAVTASELGRASAEKTLISASDAGALVALRAIFKSAAFLDDADAVRRSYLELAHLTLRRAVAAMLKNPNVGEALAAVSPPMTAEQTEREEREASGFGGAGVGSADPFGAGDAAEERRRKGEEEEALRRRREEEDATREAPLAALCAILAELYRQAPDLPSEASDALPGFLDALAEWEHSVESLVAFVGLMAAVAASGEEGAASTWRRMQTPPPGAAVTWDHFLGALVGYNRRFAYGGDAPGDDRGFGAQGPGDRDREMPEADVQGLAAYLGLLASLLTGTNPAEASRWIAWIEGRYGVELLDQLMRLHANPVPARLKAALLECVGAVGGASAEAAADVWSRMEAATILQTREGPGPARARDLNGFPTGETRPGYRARSGTGPHPHPGTHPHGGAGYGSPYRESPHAGGDFGYGAAAAARQQHAYQQQRRAEEMCRTAERNQLAVPGADLSYEFNQLEAQSRAYPHAAAYVRVVNALLAASAAARVGPAARAGRASAPQFAFIRDQVFGNLRRRQHRDQEERWSMARDAIEHFKIQLRVYAEADEADREVAPAVDAERGVGVGGGYGDASSRSATPPGYDLMIDFLSDGPTLRGLLAVLSIGADRLAAERGAAHGEALESAVLAALECLVTAFDADVDAVARLREDAAGSAVDSSHAFRRTLDAVLLQDVAQCAAVLGYVQYRFNPALPLASLRVLSVLSDRVDRLVDLLPPESRRSLVEGAASCLELAALPGGASPAGSGAAAAETEGKVAEAGALVLDVLLDTLARPAPSVAHLLLGFDATRDLESSRLDPFSEFNCASVLLELLEAAPPSFAAVGGESDGARGGAGGGGEAPETAARLVFELVADPRTAPATTALLRAWPPGAPPGQQRLPLLAADALAAPPPRDPTRRAAAAHHRAWILRAAAATLDAAAPPSGSFPAASVDDLPPVVAATVRAALFRDRAEGSTFGAFGAPSAVEHPRLAALELLATLPPTPPPPLAAAAGAAAEATRETATLRAELGVDRLLADRRPAEVGGCLEITPRGDAVISLRALGARLLEESKRALGGGGAMDGVRADAASRDAHKAAVQTAVRQARAFNASVEEHAAHVHLVSAWCDFVAVVASRCLPDDGGGGFASPEDDTQETLFVLADGVLQHFALSRGADVDAGSFASARGFGTGSAPEGWWTARDAPLARLASTLARRLRDAGAAGATLARAPRELEPIGGGDPAVGVVGILGGGGAWCPPPPLPPSRCKALLRALLAAILRPGGGGHPAADAEVRGNLYAATTSLLRYAKPQRAARLPASVLALARTKGGAGDAADAEHADADPSRAAAARAAANAAADAAAAQDEIEAGAAALIRRDAAPLVALIARDVADPAADDAVRAVALQAVEALVSAAAAAAAAEGGGGGGGDGEGASAGAARAFTVSGAPTATVGSAFASAAAPSSVSSRRVATDPALGAVGRALAESGLVRACLSAVENARLEDLILPTQNAAARLDAIRAAFSLLLRLARLPGGGAKALAESGAMAALVNCRAVDAYASDSPGDAAAAAVAADARARAAGESLDADATGFGLAGKVSKPALLDPAVAAACPVSTLPHPRATHHAVLVPAFRLAAALVHSLPDDASVVGGGLEFLRAHKAVLLRVLADRSRCAHLCDLAELEAATSLVARLATSRVPADSSISTPNTDARRLASLAVANEFIPSLDALTTTLCRGDGKYDAFIAAASPEGTPATTTSAALIARRVAESTMGRDAAVGGLSAPDAAAAAARVEARLRGIRAALVSAQLALAEQGRAAFAALEPPGHASVATERPRPTLELFARLTARCAEELREELAARARALRELAADGGAAAAAAAELDARGGDAASAEFAAAAAAAAAAPSGYAVGSLFGEDPSRGAGRAAATAAAVGARERGARALVVTVEAALELILGRVWAFRPPEMGGAGGGVETTYAMAEVETVAAALAPAVATLAELDDAAGGGAAGARVGFAGGLGGDAGRLRVLVRRARDTLVAAAPSEHAHSPAPLLAAGGGFFPSEGTAARTTPAGFAGYF